MATAATIPLHHESQSEICFAHRPWLGAAVALVSIGLLFVVRANAREAPWWAHAILAAFAVGGVLSALWRFELRLDLVMRRYRLRSGTWPRVSVREGSLDELRRLRLEQKWERTAAGRGSSERLSWAVRLDFGDAIPPVCVFSSRREEEARRRLDELAGKLGLAADGGGETRSHGDFQPRIAPPPASSTFDPARASRLVPLARSDQTIPPAPPQSGIELSNGPSGRIVLLPAFGFHVALLIPFLFGLAFAGFALLGLGAALGLVPMKVSGSRELVGLMGALFAAVGLAIAAFPVLVAGARERIEESGDTLVCNVLIYGRVFGVKRLRKDEIEAIDVRASTSSRRAAGSEVVARSKDTVVVLGRELTPESQRWLCEALASLAGRTAGGSAADR